MQHLYFRNLRFVNPYLDQIEFNLGNLSKYLIVTETSRNLCILRKDSFPILNDNLEEEYYNPEEENSYSEYDECDDSEYEQ